MRIEDVFKLPGVKTLDQSYLSKLSKTKKRLVFNLKNNRAIVNLKTNQRQYLRVVVKAKTSAELVMMVEPQSLALQLDFSIEAGGQLDFYQIILNPNRYINSLTMNMVGRGAQVRIFNLILAGAASQIVLRQDVNHSAKDIKTRVTTNRIQFDSSQSVVYGMLRINKQACQTDTYLSDKSLLLGDKCKAVAVPNLEILTDAVKASHSATCARLSAEEVFYLQARGLTVGQAKKMLITSFCQNILPTNKKIKNLVMTSINQLVHDQY